MVPLQISRSLRYHYHCPILNPKGNSWETKNVLAPFSSPKKVFAPQPQSQGQFMALGTAGRWIRLLHPISTPVPYLWMDTVPWYRKYQCSNSTILGSLCFSFTILAETLTVDDVITSEWRHYSHFGDVMWLDLISSDVTLVPLWSCQVLSLTGRF